MHISSFEEGFGRVMKVAGALEHELPLLGPCASFSLFIHEALCAEFPLSCPSFSRICHAKSPRPETYLALLYSDHLWLRHVLMLKRMQVGLVSVGGSLSSTKEEFLQPVGFLRSAWS